VLETLPLETNSDDFVFDNEMLAQVVYFGFRLGEISSPTRYFPEASTINFTRSVRYGLGVLATSIKFRLDRMKLIRSKLFQAVGDKEESAYYRQLDHAHPSETRGTERILKER
jgi:hypothetical protein